MATVNVPTGFRLQNPSLDQELTMKQGQRTAQPYASSMRYPRAEGRTARMRAAMY